MTEILNKQARTVGKEGIAGYFEELLEIHGDSHLSLDWNSKVSQELRYAVLMGILVHTDKNKNISLLDVGCGIGHLYDYLVKTGLLADLRIRYSGIDLSKKLVDFAKAKNPGVNFRVVDLLEDKFDEKFDYVFGSGLFNIRMADLGDHKRCVFMTLSRMFAAARIGLGVNFISRELMFDLPEGPEYDRYVYFTPEEVSSYCRTLTNKYILRHDYHPGDFTVYMLK